MAAGFTVPRFDGMGVYRAVLVSGPPGVGKTTAAHLVANAHGFTVVECNAGDWRSGSLFKVCSCR